MIEISTIENILSKADIEGLIEAGAPADEYAHEAKEIAIAISKLGKEQLSYDSVLSIISIVWIDYFEISAEELKLRIPLLQEVAKQILKLA